MNIAVVTGSRADLGVLHCPMKALRADPFFSVAEWNIWGAPANVAMELVAAKFADGLPDIMLVLGDRFEVMGAVWAAHLNRVPVAHIGGGDTTEGSYDDAMRDCISRMSYVHFTTSTAAAARLVSMGYRNVHLVGNPAVDYIMHEAWQREREIEGPYVVVSYYPETIDGTVDLAAVHAAIAGRNAIWISPNPDRGAEQIPPGESYSHDRFLNLLYHCEEFIGNSSAIFYEAPFLKPGGVPCRLIGKRQRGRVVPWGGEGRASERIVDALKRTVL